MKTKKTRASEIQSSIRYILNTEWDPLDAITGFSCNDKYDTYIAPIYNLLRSGASIETIAEKLLEIEQNEMGLPGVNISVLKEVAKRLLELDVLLDCEQTA